MRAGLPLTKSVLTLLVKNFRKSLGGGVKVSTSATDASLQKKIYGSGMTTLIIAKEEMKDIMEIVKYLQESGLLNRKRKNEKVDFLAFYFSIEY